MPVQQSVSRTIPAPFNGWNAKDSLDAMQPGDAIRMVNVFPDGNSCKLRRGFRTQGTGIGTGVVESLFEHADPDGTRTLIACGNDKIYNASTLGAAATDITGSTAPTSNRWQGHNFNGKLILLNGVNQPQQVDKTTVADNAWTGISDDAVLIQGCGYKNRQYLVQKASTSMWYSQNVNEITGALTEFDHGSNLTKDGFLQWVQPWTQSTGDVSNDLFVAASDKGEILVYAGTWPADAWQLIGRYFVGETLGRRSWVHIPGDLLIITADGIVPLSSLLQSSGGSDYADRINNALNAATRAYGSNWGWSGQYYAQGHYTLINVPISSSQYEQYVVNMRNGAWCKFQGQNSPSWCEYNKSLYFGGVDGKVYQADYGADDGGSRITIDLKWAFDYFGDRGHKKHFKSARPAWVANNDFQIGLDIDVDFGNKSITSSIAVDADTGDAWDVAAWDTGEWDRVRYINRNSYKLAGTGYCGALRMYGSLSGVELELNAIQVIYEQGGF